MFQETHTMRLFNAIANSGSNDSAIKGFESKLKSQSQVNFLVGSSLMVSNWREIKTFKLSKIHFLQVV